MTKKKFKFLDLLMLTTIALVLDFVTIFLFRDANKLYTISLGGFFLVLIIFRWGRAVLVPTLVVGFGQWLMLGDYSNLPQALAYTLGGLFIMIPVLAYRNRLEEVRLFKTDLLFFVFLVFLSLGFGRAVVATLARFDVTIFFEILVQHLLALALDCAVALVAVLFARGQGELLKNLDYYFDLRLMESGDGTY